MSDPAAKLADFVKYVHRNLRGDEKSEAQLFCEHLMQAFGHGGVRETGATLEERITSGKGKVCVPLVACPPV